jgi:hypothetical protein
VLIVLLLLLLVLWLLCRYENNVTLLQGRALLRRFTLLPMTTSK